MDDTAPRRGRSAQLKTLLAIVGPGLIVMVGDNDAGAFATYGQAGQNYGTRLLWTLLLLVPVLYVNQEMVLRLGAVTGVGHARLILERFGKFWGAFSVIDLFLLNALTIITEFIGITLAAGYLGLPVVAVALAAMVIIGAAFTGSFRRFERMAVGLCAGSLLLIPIYFLSHPRGHADGPRLHQPGPARRVRRAGHGDAADHRHRRHHGRALAAVLPAELRHRQADHAAVHRYEKADLWIGIVIVVLGAGRSWASPPPRSRARTASGTSPTRPGSRPACRPTRAGLPGSCSRSRCSTRRSSARSRSRCPPPTRSATCWA